MCIKSIHYCPVHQDKKPKNKTKKKKKKKEEEQDNPPDVQDNNVLT
jgi:hypothetical protein